jgi:hypothetical protein
MAEADSYHCRIVNRTLTGKRAVDEQTFSSLAVLAERLERLKRLDKIFSNIEFSHYVKKLRSRSSASSVEPENAVPVG